MLISTLLAASLVPDPLPLTAMLEQLPQAPDLTSYDHLPASCDVGNATEEQRAALAPMDFFIGDYAVTGHVWTGGGWSPPRPGTVPARWNGRYGLDGAAILDEWFDEDPGTKPDTLRGINARMAKDDGTFYMSWVSSHAQGVQHLTASVGEDGLLRMVQLYPERPGFEATFVEIDPDHWVRISVAPGPDGQPGTPVLLNATRIACN